MVVVGKQARLLPHDGHAFQPRDAPPSRPARQRRTSSTTIPLLTQCLCLATGPKTCVCVALVGTACCFPVIPRNVHSFSPSHSPSPPHPAQTTPHQDAFDPSNQRGHQVSALGGDGWESSVALHGSGTSCWWAFNSTWPSRASAFGGWGQGRVVVAARAGVEEGRMACERGREREVVLCVYTHQCSTTTTTTTTGV